ncbi:MAG: YaaR family protein [Selenomonas sp.]|uniref:YaaR family protein n=1 Tax=Selenomonas sp. TaxID=2053611 RepID=UPI0025F1D7B5|nr:YaaR family protein [Selenomonas sp.]MCR5439049.1 YaaR family protein [Selenomonas sp.]
MPMKIDNMTTKGPSISVSRSSEDERVRDMDTDFSTELRNQEEAVTTEQLDKLLRQIDEQGARLSKTPTYDELKSYRTLIKNFVGEAVNHMYELHTQAGWDRMGRQKVYTTVRKIDKRLEEMAEKIRLGQASQLDIVASHDAIRGMLVDLYM